MRIPTIKWKTFAPSLVALLHGGLAASVVFLLLYSHAEDRIFARIAHRAISLRTPTTAPDTLRALATAASTLTRIGNLYTNTSIAGSGIREGALASADFQLLGRGGCGSSSIVMARLLNQVDIPARIFQMRCGDKWGCHIAVEARIHGKWVVVDPWFNLVYPLPNGTLASAAELRTSWALFEQSLPGDYLREYRYEGVRYTNWSKIPLVGSAVPRLLRDLGASRIDSVSLGTSLINRYRTYALILIVVWLGFGSWTVLALRGRTNPDALAAGVS